MSTLPTHPRHRLVAIGVVAAALTVAGTGTAMAVAPTAPVSQAVARALHAAGVDWSAMPDGYTQAQYEAFWDAGYTAEDVDALAALWDTGSVETKARAGQMILDGQTPPVAPGSTPGTDLPADEGDEQAAAGEITAEQSVAFWDAGYTVEDVEALTELWDTGYIETKARAGQMILDGQTVPVAPSGQPSDAATATP